MFSHMRPFLFQSDSEAVSESSAGFKSLPQGGFRAGGAHFDLVKAAQEMGHEAQHLFPGWSEKVSESGAGHGN